MVMMQWLIIETPSHQVHVFKLKLFRTSALLDRRTFILYAQYIFFISCIIEFSAQKWLRVLVCICFYLFSIYTRQVLGSKYGWFGPVSSFKVVDMLHQDLSDTFRLWLGGAIRGAKLHDRQWCAASKEQWGATTTATTTADTAWVPCLPLSLIWLWISVILWIDCLDQCDWMWTQFAPVMPCAFAAPRCAFMYIILNIYIYIYILKIDCDGMTENKRKVEVIMKILVCQGKQRDLPKSRRQVRTWWFH